MSNWPHMHIRKKAVIFFLPISVFEAEIILNVVHCICWFGYCCFEGEESRLFAPFWLVMRDVLKWFKSFQYVLKWLKWGVKSALSGSLGPRGFWVRELVSSWDIHTVNVAWLFPRRQSGSLEGKITFLKPVRYLVRYTGHQNIKMNNTVLSSSGGSESPGTDRHKTKNQQTKRPSADIHSSTQGWKIWSINPPYLVTLVMFYQWDNGAGFKKVNTLWTKKKKKNPKKPMPSWGRV